MMYMPCSEGVGILNLMLSLRSGVCVLCVCVPCYIEDGERALFLSSVYSSMEVIAAAHNVRPKRHSIPYLVLYF